MSNYSKATNFTAKDALATGNPSKIIKGSEFDTEFDAIATSIATKLDTTGSAASLTDHKFVQRVEATPYVTQGSDASAFPLDGTIPQLSEGGGPYLTATITPTKIDNRLVIECTMVLGSDSGNTTTVALFQDSTANALAATLHGWQGSGYVTTVTLRHEMAAGTTSSTAFKIKIGNNTGSVYVNRSAGQATLYGGVLACRLSVTEVEN